MTARPRKKKRKAAAGKAARKTRGAKAARLRKKAPAKAAKKAAKKPARPRAKTSAALRKTAKSALRRPLASAGRRLKSAGPKRIARARVTPRRGAPRPATGTPGVPGVVVIPALAARHPGLRVSAALRFLADLHREFDARRASVIAPRGETDPDVWSAIDPLLTIDREPIAAVLLAFGLHALRAAKDSGATPFAVPPPGSVEEARLWSDVFAFAHERLGLPAGTLRASVPASLDPDIRAVLGDPVAAPPN